MKTVVGKEKLIEYLTKAKKHYEQCKVVLEKDGIINLQDISVL